MCMRIHDRVAKTSAGAGHRMLNIADYRLRSAFGGERGACPGRARLSECREHARHQITNSEGHGYLLGSLLFAGLLVLQFRAAKLQFLESIGQLLFERIHFFDRLGLQALFSRLLLCLNQSELLLQLRLQGG